nr:MAG TPA: hypothetical protein [Caudoviricetes sp.]
MTARASDGTATSTATMSASCATNAAALTSHWVRMSVSLTA